MISATSNDNGDDELDDLSPAQREKLQRQVQSVYKELIPKVTLKVPDFGYDTSAISKIAADVAKLGQFKISPAWLKNFTAASILAEQNAKMVESLKPYLEVQGALQKQITPITSDLIKWTSAAIQPQFNLLGSQLLKNINFGWTDELARLGQQFPTRQEKWFENLNLLFSQITDAFYPSNLSDGITLEQIEQVVMLDGIALYEVPRAEIAEKLVHATTSNARREIIGRRWQVIAVDCRRVLASCELPDVVPLVRFATHAIDALESGNAILAQSLVGSLLDTILRKYLPEQRPLLLPSKKTKNAEAYLDRTVKEYIALAPIWQAYQNYRQENGDPVPRAFNRHATAHAVGTLQYSRRNAIQGLMIVCGLLKFLDQRPSRKRR